MFEMQVEGDAKQEAIGGYLALNCTPPYVVYLRGDLGAGKTTLVRGFLRGAGYQGSVKSPTYTLLEPYELGFISCYHIDLYRLADVEELEYLGIKDLLRPDAYLLIEWPERGEGGLPQPDLVIDITHQGEARCLQFHPKNDKAREIIQRMQDDLLNG
jgi:tRNA threonylcarbamoyladenosine biosynthesis protein TsaE